MIGEWSRNINTDPIGKRDRDRIKGVQTLIAHLIARQQDDLSKPDLKGLVYLQQQPEHGVGYTEVLLPMMPDYYKD